MKNVIVAAIFGVMIGSIANAAPQAVRRPWPEIRPGLFTYTAMAPKPQVVSGGSVDIPIDVRGDTSISIPTFQGIGSEDACEIAFARAVAESKSSCELKYNRCNVIKSVKQETDSSCFYTAYAKAAQ